MTNTISTIYTYC